MPSSRFRCRALFPSDVALLHPGGQEVLVERASVPQTRALVVCHLEQTSPFEPLPEHFAR